MALVKAVADYYAQLTKSNNGTRLGHCELYQALCELRAKKWNQLAMKKSSCVMNGAGVFERGSNIVRFKVKTHSEKSALSWYRCLSFKFRPKIWPANCSLPTTKARSNGWSLHSAIIDAI